MNGNAGIERRLLILTPVGRDASLIEAMLAKDYLACFICRDLETLARELAVGAAALLITEEVFAEGDVRLAKLIAAQPAWSDLPVLILTRQGADSPAVTWAVKQLGNVTLLERPIRMGALVSAVRSALRARDRQYQIRAHLEDRELANQRKDEFLAMLAHELRNPLAPLRNSVQLLRISGAASQVCEMMDRQVGYIVRLIDDLMEVSRITRGKLELRRTTVDLATIINAAVETSRPQLDAARHELRMKLPAEPLLLEADPIRLAQVFSNLLNNAGKYTPPGGKLMIEARVEAGVVFVTVKDNGIGIEPEALPHVFDMFMQAERHSASAQTGLGIGLTLARQFVELHGGSITAASPGPGQGSSFTVQLHLTTAQPTVPGVPEPSLPRFRQLPRILVVDDNRDAANSLAALLHLLGAETRVVHDGPSALATLEAFQPAIVFLDLGMPGMSGYDVARKIREREVWQNTKLIALTGWGREKDRRLTEAAGFNHHLIKPADLAAMQAVLAQVLH